MASKKKSGKRPSAPRKKITKKTLAPKKKKAPAAAKQSKAAKPAKKVPRATTSKSVKRTPAKALRKTAAIPSRRIEVKVGSAVPKNGKTVAAAITSPRSSGKNTAGLSVKELAYFRDLLLAKRRELVGDVSSMEDEALRSSGSGQSNLSTLPIHMADMGTDNYEQEFTLGLVEKDRNLLRDIQAALGKMVAGTYGICEGTGKPIAKPRLEAQPWARFSIEYARSLEQRRMRA